MKSVIYNIHYIFRKEFYTIFRDQAVLVFFIALTLLYPLVYTYIYSNEVVRKVPVAVVNNSNSSVSREFIRNWNASANVDVVAKCADLEEARELMYRKEIYGILQIPAEFGKQIARGEQAHVSLFCDMGGLLNYKALLLAASEVSIAMGKNIQVAGLDVVTKKQGEIAASPVRIEEIKMFNPQGGFASFIIPAVLVLVIQQSLLLGVGTIAGTARDRSRKKRLIPANRHYRNPFSILIGKMLAYLPVYLVMSFWVFLIVPRIFGLTQIGGKGELLVFLLPFLLACVFFAITLSFLCKEREMPFLLFVFTSIPLMFISGISWPRTAIPDYWVAFSKIFPSTHGIDGFVKINNMGASLTEVLPEWHSLWILTAVYFAIASLLYCREIKKTFK